MNLLNPLHWFTLMPPEVSGFAGKAVFVVFLAMFILGIVGRIVAFHRTEDRYIRLIGSRLGALCTTMGILGLILFFFSFEGVQLFGARFWYPMWLLTVLVWGLFIGRFIKRDIPAMREVDLHKKANARYLPRKKRKR